MTVHTPIINVKILIVFLIMVRNKYCMFYGFTSCRYHRLLVACMENTTKIKYNQTLQTLPQHGSVLDYPLISSLAFDADCNQDVSPSRTLCISCSPS